MICLCIGNLDELNQQFNIHDSQAEEYKHMSDVDMEEQKVAKQDLNVNVNSLYNIIDDDDKSYDDVHMTNLEDDKSKTHI